MGEWHSQHLLGCQFSVLCDYNILNLIVCGGREHRALKITQLEIQTVQDPDDPSLMTVCLVYTWLKDRPGGSKQLDLANKL